MEDTGMKERKSMNSNHLARNLSGLRQASGLSQEKVAEAVGVTRQAVAKWELGESTPDVLHCDALAELYGVSLDDLLHFDQKGASVPVPPRGKHVFGVAQVGERGQIVIPKAAREVFGIRPGDTLLMLGDEGPEHQGLALMDPQIFFARQEQYRRALERREIRE